MSKLPVLGYIDGLEIIRGIYFFERCPTNPILQVLLARLGGNYKEIYLTPDKTAYVLDEITKEGRRAFRMKEEHVFPLHCGCKLRRFPDKQLACLCVGCKVRTLHACKEKSTASL